MGAYPQFLQGEWTMAKGTKTLNWWWFLSAMPLLAIVGAVQGVGLLVEGEGLNRKLLSYPYPWLGYVIASAVWYLFGVRRLGLEKADPPLYFNILWLGVIGLEVLVFDFLYSLRHP